MLKHTFSDFSYAVNIESAKKGYKEILVCYIYNGIEVLRKVYIPEGNGISYIFEARKVIDKEIKDGTLSAYSYKFIRRNKKRIVRASKPKNATELIGVNTDNAPILRIGKEHEVKKESNPSPFSNFVYELCPYDVNRKKEVRVTFLYNGNKVIRTHKFRKKIGTDYVAKSRDKIKDEIKSGFLKHYSEKYLFDRKVLDTLPTKQPVVRTGTSGKVIAAICLVAALVIAGTTLGVYFGTRGGGTPEPVPPAPVTSYSVQFVGDDCNWEKKETVGANEKYTCKIFPKEDITKREVIIKSVIMGDAILAEGNGKDFTFLDNTLTIEKPAIGNIVITAATRENTFNVYCSHKGCSYLSADDPTQEAPETTPRNSQYRCVLRPLSTEDHVVIVGVSMGGRTLTPGDTDGYTFIDDSASPDYGLLTVTAYATTNISIIAMAEPNVPSQYPVFIKPVGCVKIAGGEIAYVGTNYVCQIKPLDATNNKASIVSVAIGGVIKTENTDYTVEDEAEGAVELTIPSANILGQVSITAVAVNKSQESFNVNHTDNETCEIEHQATVLPGNTLTCTVTPTTATDMPRVVAVVMGNRLLTKEAEYTTAIDIESHVLTLEVPNVLGDVSVFAVAESAETNADSKKMVAVVAQGCKIEGDEIKNNLSIQAMAEGDKPKQFFITNSTVNTWINIVSVSMGVQKLYSIDNYTYDCANNGKFEFVNDLTATDDIVVIAQVVPAASTVFMVDRYAFGCEFDGANTVKLKEGYTAVVKADEPEHFKPDIKIIMGGKVLTMPNDYTFEKKTTNADEEEWALTINDNVITNDLSIFVMAIDKDRAYFNVDCYCYGGTYLCPDYPSGTVPSGTTGLTATITGSSNLVPSVDCIYMGNKKLNITTEYTFSTLGSTGTLKILTAITGDVVIYATTHSADWVEVTASCEKVGGVMTATSIPEPGSGKTKADITQVTIPTEYSSFLNPSNAEPVKKVSEGLLNGCSYLQKLKTPFIGLSKDHGEAGDYYDHIIGKMFGSNLYEGVLTLTWQSFYAEETDQGETTYKIAKAAIPHSFRTVEVTEANAEIPIGAFSQCSHLESVSFTEGTTQEVGAYAFNGCSALKSVQLPSQTLSKVGRHAFENCLMLETTNVPNVTEIEHDAFVNCNGLYQLVTPSIQKVGHNAFGGISSTAMIIVAKSRDEVAEAQRSGDWATDWVDDTTFVIYGSTGNLTMHIDKNNNYRFIIVKDAEQNDCAFVVEFIGDDWATELTIPASLTTTIDGQDKSFKVIEIGAQVFYGFTKFETLTFEQPANDTNDLQVIGNYCFTACPAIEKIVGLDSLTKLEYIGHYAFDRCTSLGMVKENNAAVEVKLPSSVKQLGKYAFAYCDSLTTVNLADTQITELEEKTFYNSGLASAEITTSTPFAVNLPQGQINKFGSDIFAGSTRLTSLSIKPAAGCDTIPTSICDGCTALTTFTWDTSSASLVNIDSYAWRNCSKLTSVSIGGSSANKIPSTLMSIGDQVFAGCTSMSSFSLGAPSGNQKANFTIGFNVFEGWGSSQSLYIEVSTGSGGWANRHDTISGSVELSFGWTCSHNSGYLRDATYHSSSTGSIDLIIRYP